MSKDQSKATDKYFNWFGDLTIDLVESVAQKIYELLNGRRYTFVAVNMMGETPGRLAGRPDVRTSQKIRGEPGMWFDDENDPPCHGGFHFSDTYGVWGLSTSLQPGQKNEDYQNPYINFEHGHTINITHRAPAGHLLCWTIVLEKENTDD